MGGSDMVEGGSASVGPSQSIVAGARNSISGALRSPEGAMFLLVFLCFALTALPLAGTNEGSHVALTEAILYNHSLSLGSYAGLSGMDSSYFGGHMFSTMAPGESVLLIIPFSIGTLLSPLLDPLLSSFAAGSYATPSQVLALQLFSAFCSAVSTLYVYRLCRSLGAKKWSSIATGLTYAFATLIWVFGKTSFAHTYSALFLVLTYYYVLRTRTPPMRDAILAGVFAAVALSLEYTNLVLLLPAIVYLAINRRREVKKEVAFIIPVVISGFLLLVYNLICFSNLLSFPEDFWIEYTGPATSLLGKFSTPIFVGLSGLLLSPKTGLLFFSPAVLLGLGGFFLLAKRKRYQTAIIGSVFLANLLTYSMWYLWSGGATYGPRFLVPSLPFVVVPTFAVIERVGAARTTLAKLAGTAALAGVFTLSTIVTSLGAITSPIGVPKGTALFAFLTDSTTRLGAAQWPLKDLVAGVVYVAAKSVGIVQPLTGLLVWMVAIAVPGLAFAVALGKAEGELADAGTVG